ncbi:hypothetical protein [Neoroseomonas oryzicola]|uniref:Uncharacterized protein n=2 Tax=Neoroseomonas oryzicola TaxID=535904 RepID=A0A9X9WJG1_9PROT|nr:hypothetical protein [Neoroseomonas oryzicola]MBR0660471.1 hypothetical protein [Neoroseomonas oryzicola]NKE18239.1 hypothetical protein [Neoroseomonas oryzicola]
MTEQSEPGAPARLDWLELSEDLQAVVDASRDVATAVDRLTAEHDRLGGTNDARQLQEALDNANQNLASAADALDRATRRLSEKAVAIVGLALDAEHGRM